MSFETIEAGDSHCFGKDHQKCYSNAWFHLLALVGSNIDNFRHDELVLGRQEDGRRPYQVA